MRALQLAAILAVFHCLCSAADQASPTSIWQNLGKYVAEESRATGSFASSLSTAYHGSNALGLLGSDKDIDSRVLCPLAEKELEKDLLDLESARLAAHVLKHARCPKAKGSAAAENVARQALRKEVPDGVTGYAALSTLSALGKKASAPEMKNALVQLAKQQAVKGRLKMGSKGSPSLKATACGYLAGAEASSMGALDSDSYAAFQALVFGIPQVLESASRSSFWSDADDDALEAVALFLKGIDDTCSKDCSLSQQQLGLLAQHLLRVSDVGSLKDAHHILQSIVALSGDGKLPKAVIPSLKTPTVAITEGVVAVALQDMKGTPTEGQEVKGTIMKGKKGTPRELQFTAKGAGQYEASLPMTDMSLGTHQLTVVVTGKNGETVASETFAVALVGMVEVKSAVLSIKRLDPASTKQKEELEYPQQLQKPLHLQPGMQLKAVFTPIWNPLPSKGFVPQQAFMSLKSRASSKMVLVAAKAGKDGAYTASLTPEIVSNQIGTQAGDFDATLTVADDCIAQAILWHLGTVNISHASAAVPTPSAAQLMSSPKPEILHIFQAPGRRPPAAVSMAFTVLSVAPLGFLLIHLSNLGVNLKGFPTDGPALLNTMAFHGGVAGILLLYFVFWVRLTLIDMLLPLLVLSLFTFYFGYLALKRLAKVESNLKQE